MLGDKDGVVLCSAWEQAAIALEKHGTRALESADGDKFPTVLSRAVEEDTQVNHGGTLKLSACVPECSILRCSWLKVGPL